VLLLVLVARPPHRLGHELGVHLDQVVEQLPARFIGYFPTKGQILPR